MPKQRGGGERNIIRNSHSAPLWSIEGTTIVKVVRKGFAYITSGRRLLLFTHPESPEAGIQVPAGSMNPGEKPRDGALREACEETGLTSLRAGRFLGRQILDARPYGREEYNDRWFFHILCDGEVPDTWTHGEADASDGTPGFIPFAFFWADLASGIPPLIADHDRFIAELIQSVSREGRSTPREW
jgi:8-oxo-dGTP diphosphatase